MVVISEGGLDLLVVGICLVLQLCLTALAINRKSLYAAFFATLIGFLMSAAIASYGGLLSYTSGGVEVDIAPNAFFLIILTLPTFYDAFLLISLHRLGA